MTSRTIELKGKTALVTGSARRIGREIGLELARQGMNLIIHHGSSDAEAASALREAQALGVQAQVIKADLRDPGQISAMFAQVERTMERLDVLVNSASVFASGAFLEVTLEAWQSALAVNLTAPFLCSQHAARLMGEQGGTIINILDLSAYAPWKSYPHHSVSKAGLKMLTEVMALSLAPRIRVNGIAPGPMLRDEGNSPEQWERIGQRLPLKHTGDPADVARAVTFLATEPFITGAILQVDGGELLL